jgi:hypothetical protein
MNINFIFLLPRCASPRHALAIMRDDAVLHDPTRRRFLATRGFWELRAAPGECSLGLPWLHQGLFHLQFFAPDAAVSVLAFPAGAPCGRYLVHTAPNHTVVVRKCGVLRNVAFDASALDDFLEHECQLPRSANGMARIVRQLHEHSLGVLLRARCTQPPAATATDRAALPPWLVSFEKR